MIFFFLFLCYVSSFIRIYPTYLLPPNGRNSSLSLSKKGDTLGLVAFLLYRNLLPSKSAYKVQILQKFPKLGAFVTRQREIHAIFDNREIVVTHLVWNEQGSSDIDGTSDPRAA